MGPRNFQNMINEYIDMDLIYNEVRNQSWILSNIEERKDWQGGNFVIPMAVSSPNSIKFGSLVALNSIVQTKTIRPYVGAYKEVWASLLFNEADLVQNGEVNEQNFIQLLPKEITRLVTGMKNAIGLNILSGRYISSVSADGNAGGLITVTNPERFEPRQYVVFTSSAVPLPGIVGYVSKININTGVLTIVTTVDGSTAVNLSTILAADTALVSRDGQADSTLALTSIPDILLPSGAGGTTNFYSAATAIPKADFPMLQAIAASGAGITTSNILSKIFAHYVLTRKRGQGQPNNVAMSYTNFGACLQVLETQKGAFNVIPGSQKTSQYGWDEIMVGGFEGTLKLVALNEMNDSMIHFLDFDSMLLASNGGMRRRTGPDGLNFYTNRDDTLGYRYVVDQCLYGEFVLHSPGKNGILYGIPTLTLG